MGQKRTQTKFESLRKYLEAAGVEWKDSDAKFVEELYTWINIIMSSSDDVLQRTGAALYRYYVLDQTASEAGATQHVHWSRQSFYSYLMGRALQDANVLVQPKVQIDLELIREQKSKGTEFFKAALRAQGITYE